jgi:glycosyltransferase involved in cell wall biosynthesis
MDLKQHGSILYISWVDVSIGDGPGVNEREFILALHRCIGDRAHFLVPQPEGEITELPASSFTVSRPHRHHNFRYFPGHVLSQMRLGDRLLSRRRFDLLLFRLDVLPIAPLYLTRRHRIPYALKTLGQGTINALAESGGHLGRALMGFNQRLVKQLVSRALVADSVSVMQVNYLQKLFQVERDRIVWIDNAVNTDRFFPVAKRDARRELGIAAFDPIIGYVGTRAWERGGMQLIEIAPRLLVKYPNLALLILGDGAGIDDMKQRARELGVAEHCIFTGYVPFERVPLYVNSLDVGVSISVREDRRAASELKVRQYLACGKPAVIAPGSNDFVAEARLGSIVPPADLDAITAECDRWLSLNDDERDAFARRATAYVRDHLTVEAAVTKRLELWSERLQRDASRDVRSDANAWSRFRPGSIK